MSGMTNQPGPPFPPGPLDRPFAEAEMIRGDTDFEEIGRERWLVRGIQGDGNMILTSENGDWDYIPLDDVSENDRPFVKRGTWMVEVNGRRTHPHAGHVWFWVIESWLVDGDDGRKKVMKNV